MCNGPYLDFISIKAYNNFERNPSIWAQDIEWKQIFDIF